jgi:hypothetical protein
MKQVSLPELQLECVPTHGTYDSRANEYSNTDMSEDKYIGCTDLKKS